MKVGTGGGRTQKEIQYLLEDTSVVFPKKKRKKSLSFFPSFYFYVCGSLFAPFYSPTHFVFPFEPNRRYVCPKQIAEFSPKKKTTS